MKKVYSLLLGLAAVCGLGAQAQTLTVEVDHPECIQFMPTMVGVSVDEDVPWMAFESTTTTLTVDELVSKYAEADSDPTALTKCGIKFRLANASYTMTYEQYSEDDVLDNVGPSFTKTVKNSQAAQLCYMKGGSANAAMIKMGQGNYGNGKLVIKVQVPEGNKSMTVNVEGNASDVMYMFYPGQTAYKTLEAAGKLEYAPAAQTMYLRKADGSKFGSVVYNGKTIEAQGVTGDGGTVSAIDEGGDEGEGGDGEGDGDGDGDEQGNVTYQYSFSIVDNGVLDIVVAAAPEETPMFKLICNDPAHISIVPSVRGYDADYNYKEGVGEPIVFDADGYANVYKKDFPFEATGDMMNYTLIAKPAKGYFMKNLNVYDAENQSYMDLSNYTDEFMITISYVQGGYANIEVAEIKVDTKVKVEVEGDASKVLYALEYGETPVALPESKEIEFSSASVSGVFIYTSTPKKFYSVTYGEEEIEAEDAGDYNAEGNYVVTSYYYYVGHPEDGSTIYVNTEWPDVNYKVTIDVPEAFKGVVQKVTVDGETVENFSAFEVHIGSNLYVKTNSSDYSVGSISVNGETSFVVWGRETPYTNAFGEGYTFEEVRGDINIVISDVKAKEKDLEAVVYTQHFDRAFDTTKGFYLSFRDTDYEDMTIGLEEGYNIIEFGEWQNDFSLSCHTRGELETEDGKTVSANFFAVLNNEFIEFPWGDAVITLEGSDVLKLYFEYNTEELPVYGVKFDVQGLESEPIVVLDYTMPVELDGEAVPVLPGTRVAVIPDYEPITVKANGVEVTADETGIFFFDITADTQVAITGATSGITSIEAANAAGRKVYNLQGIEINAETLSTGLYIINGQKVYVK